MARALEVIQPHPSWEIIDSSKLTLYMECPRKYFYRHVVGWDLEASSNHLVFGSAWHLAVEHLLRNDYSRQSLEEAKILFLNYYRQHFGEDTDELFVPKDPENALLSLQQYAKRFISDIHQYKVLHTEIAGVVLISPTAEMHFKLDAVVENREAKKILYIDHKTSQRRYEDWRDHYLLSTQMLLYYHALNCFYSREEIEACIIRTTFFYTSESRVKSPRYFKPTLFEEGLIVKNDQQMQDWLIQTNVWYQNLKYDMLLLEEEESTERSSMMAFAKNPTNCFSYGRPCEFLDFCAYKTNPLPVVAQGIPLGFQESFWDPRESPEIRETVNLVSEEKKE